MFSFANKEHDLFRSADGFIDAFRGFFFVNKQLPMHSKAKKILQTAYFNYWLTQNNIVVHEYMCVSHQNETWM
jgi:hypothetical protein